MAIRDSLLLDDATAALRKIVVINDRCLVKIIHWGGSYQLWSQGRKSNKQMSKTTQEARVSEIVY